MKASRPTQEATTAKGVSHYQEANITKEMHGMKMESMAKNTLRELLHTKEELIEPNTDFFMCRLCREL